MEPQTPPLVSQDLDSLSLAIDGLSLAVRERTRSETASSHTSSIPATDTPLRFLTRAEIELESVKSSLRKAQHDRTSDRIAELRDDADEVRQGSRISVDSESKIKLGDLNRRLRERKSTTPLQENVSSSGVPPTIARKNITTRRSKSRKKFDAQ